jgi:hypothetical protein
MRSLSHSENSIRAGRLGAFSQLEREYHVVLNLNLVRQISHLQITATTSDQVSIFTWQALHSQSWTIFPFQHNPQKGKSHLLFQICKEYPHLRELKEGLGSYGVWVIALTGRSSARSK